MTIKEITKDYIYMQVSDAIGSRLDGVYVKSRREWRIPHNLGALRDLHMLGYDVLHIGNKLTEEYKNVLHSKERISTQHIDDRLREYQKQDVAFLAEQTYAGVFNEQRTGKSPTMCKVIESIGESTIVVCPASLILNWRDEVLRWTGLRPLAVMGTKKQRERIYKDFHMHGGVLIVGKESVRNDLSLVQSLKFHTLVVDEAHFLRNRTTKQSSSIVSLGKLAKRKYALTGTPATSKAADVFGILHFLDPSRWSSYWQFAERYFKVTATRWGGGSKDVGEFKSELRKKEYEELLNLVSVQRKRKDVMKWLPAKQYQTIKLPMTAPQRKAYDEMRTMFEVESVGLDASTVLSQLMRLRQITSVPQVLGLESGVKEAFIMEWLEDNPNEQVLIFSNFSSGLKLMAEKIGAKKYKYGTIIGDDTKEERNKNVQAFQNGKLQVLLCNIEAAGTGLTLDSASTVIFIDRHANPAQNEQAEDRIIATVEGRNTSSTIIDLVCEQSIDEKIIELVKQKKDLTSIVNDYKNMGDWLK